MQFAGLVAYWCFGARGRVCLAGFKFSIGASVFALLLVVPKKGSSDKMNCKRGGRLFPLWLCAVVCLMSQHGACNVVLISNNTTLSFNDVEATFSKCYTLPSILVDQLSL